MPGRQPGTRRPAVSKAGATTKRRGATAARAKGAGAAAGAPTSAATDAPGATSGIGTALRSPDPSRAAVIRWASRAHSIAELQRELARMWAAESTPPGIDLAHDETREAHVQARTSVLNLLVVARRPEIGERAAATISRLTGRHPSRTVILSPADPDGPRWVDAQLQAVCLVPHGGGHQTCSEIIYLTAGGDAGRHLNALASPLLITDLPVATWWPGDVPFASPGTFDLIEMSDRFIVDGSTWSGSGRERLTHLAAICSPSLAVCDFGLMRQSRWREAIASTFDVPEYLAMLRSLRRISVTYGTHDESGDPEGTNIVKPVYHVAWLASRLGMKIVSSLRPAVPGTPARQRARTGSGAPIGRAGPRPVPGGFDARLRLGRNDVDVVMRPRLSAMPGGTTLRVELLAQRRGSELRADVTAEAETVHVRCWRDGVEAMERRSYSPRRTDVDLLAETIERTGPDPIATAAIEAAGELVSLAEPDRGEGRA